MPHFWPRILNDSLVCCVLLLGYQSVPGGTTMRQARSAGQLPIRAQSGNSARPITGQQQQMMSSQRIMQGRPSNTPKMKLYAQHFKMSSFGQDR